MIKATELRIGNIVNEGNNPIVVKDICNIGINSEVDSYGHCDQIYHTLFKNIEPIPITQEWLVKFGFKQADGLLELIMDKEKCLSFHESKMYLLSGQFSEMTSTINLKYVHQLQNLYFALTGEELIPQK